MAFKFRAVQCTSPSNLNILSVKQKAAVRIVNNSSYNSHTDPIFKSLNILPLTNLIEFFKIQFVFKFINGELPGSFDSTWTRNEDLRVTVLSYHSREITPTSTSHQLAYPQLINPPFLIFPVSGALFLRTALQILPLLSNSMPN